MTITARAYQDRDDLRRMQSLQQELWAREAERTHTHIGDLAWWTSQHMGREAEWKRHLWLDGDRCVAWVWLDRPSSLDYEVHVDLRGGSLHEDVLEWFEAEAEGEGPLETIVMDGDDTSRTLLERHGFESAPDGSWYAYFVQEPTAREPEPPEGFAFRTVHGEVDLRERVAVHRAAWDPSRVTDESYRNVMRTWPYRADLDCVLEGRDGRFVAYVLCWYDEQNRVGELEPVGVHPDFQRRGLGAAVCNYALSRLAEEGAEKAIVYAMTDATCSFYESVGFRRHTTVRTVRKKRR